MSYTLIAILWKYYYTIALAKKMEESDAYTKWIMGHFIIYHLYVIKLHYIQSTLNDISLVLQTQKYNNIKDNR